MSRNAEETFGEKVIRKTKEQPLVPIGALVTVGFLWNGIRAFKRSDKARAQSLMRGRVIAQGFTVIVLAVGTFMGMKPPERPKSMEQRMQGLENDREKN